MTVLISAVLSSEPIVIALKYVNSLSHRKEKQIQLNWRATERLVIASQVNITSNHDAIRCFALTINPNWHNSNFCLLRY